MPNARRYPSQSLLSLTGRSGLPRSLGPEQRANRNCRSTELVEVPSGNKRGLGQKQWVRDGSQVFSCEGLDMFSASQPKRSAFARASSSERNIIPQAMISTCSLRKYPEYMM